MKNQYIHPMTLQSVTQLFQERTSKIRTLINSLKLKDVEQDDEFEKTKQRIKNAVLLEPVVFEDPKFIDHEYEEKQPKLEHQFFSNVSSDNYIHEIRFSFKGDSNLLGYGCENMSFSSSDHGIIPPHSSNHVTVYAELPTLSLDGAINLANTHFSLTKSIAEKNGESAKIWNVAVGQKIDADLDLKRDELIRIFKQ